jgi:transposase
MNEKKDEREEEGLRSAERGRRPTGADRSETPIKRWSAQRKREAVLRLLRGEALDGVSRDLGIELYRLQEWRERALAGMEEALTDRPGDPLEAELAQARQVIGDLHMEVELLKKSQPVAPGRRRWKR